MGGNGGNGCDILVPTMMDNSTAFSTLGAFVFFVFLASALSGNANFAEVQNSSVKNRLSYASHINVSICCLSMSFHFMHVLGGLLRADHGMLVKMSFFEYMLTCPWMMLVFVLLGGPKVDGARYRMTAMSVTTLVLLFGFIASLVTNPLMKTTCFAFGLGLFCGIIYIINRCVVEHSDGQESLLNGNLSSHASWYKTLAKKIFLTWVLFPIWWVLSPEGFAIATDSHDVDALVKLILNCFAKGLYILYIRSLQSRFKNETDQTLSLPASHTAQKGCATSPEKCGKRLDQHGAWRSSNMDIEIGAMPAEVECQPSEDPFPLKVYRQPSLDDLSDVQFASKISTSSTRPTFESSRPTFDSSRPTFESSGRNSFEKPSFQYHHQHSGLEFSSEELPPPPLNRRPLQGRRPSNAGSLASWDTCSVASEELSRPVEKRRRQQEAWPPQEAPVDLTQAELLKLMWKEVQDMKGQIATPQPSQHQPVQVPPVPTEPPPHPMQKFLPALNISL